MSKSKIEQMRKFIREEFDPRDVTAMDFLTDVANKNGVSYATLLACETGEEFIGALSQGIGYTGSVDDFMPYVAEVSKRLEEALKPAEEKRFGVFSPDGTTLDIDGKEWENIQLIDIIEARSFTDALAEAKDNLEIGAYEGFDSLHLREISKGREFGEGVEE